MTATAARREAPPRRVALRKAWLPSRLAPYAFVAPALVCLVTFSVVSIFVAAVVSLTNLDISGLADFSQVRFIGLANYQALFGDPAFWEALGNTAFFVIVGLQGAAHLLFRAGDHRHRRDLIDLGKSVQQPVRPAQLAALSGRARPRPVAHRSDDRQVLGGAGRDLAGVGPRHDHLSRRAAGDSAGVLRGGRDRWGTRVAADLQHHPAVDAVRNLFRDRHHPHRLDAVLR